MAYVNPAFLFDSIVRVAGASNLTPKYATVAGQGVERLLDWRLSPPLAFSASHTDHDVEIDRTGIATPSFDTLWIPPGHNLSTASSIEVYRGTTSPASTLVATISLPVTNGEPVEGSFSLVSSGHTFVRVKINGAGTWQIPELVLGRKLAPTTGVRRDWRQPLETPLTEIAFPSREYATLLAQPRRTYRLEHEGRPDPDPIYGPLAKTRALPFVFWPPDGGLSFIARLRGDLEQEQDAKIPKNALSYTYRYEVIEQGG